MLTSKDLRGECAVPISANHALPLSDPDLKAFPATPMTAFEGKHMLENASILVVDDEALIRMAMTSIVEDAGYSAMEAANADEAITMLEHRQGIAAVLTDINMPGSMDG